MIWTLLLTSTIFIIVGFVITENNAKYLLAGYNTMSEKDKKQVDIKTYIGFFRKFHLFLGVSNRILGLIFTYLIDKTIGGIFLVTYPILAYIYLAVGSLKYYKRTNSKQNKIGVIILLITLVFVGGLLISGIKEDQLIVNTDSIEFEGNYGEILTSNQITSIKLVNKLPNISLKTNGFAISDIKKGFFKTENGEVIKLILNANNKPFILFIKSDGKKIYYSAKKESSKKILIEIKQLLPNIIYE